MRAEHPCIAELLSFSEVPWTSEVNGVMSEITTARYSLGEEIAHSVVHGLGIILSIVGLAVLVGYASMNGDSWHIVSSGIYGATLIVLYSASTLYHAVTHARVKQVLQRIDHAAIYLLIAGTYTPFALVSLRGPWGWTLFGVVWGVAMLGVVIESFHLKRLRRLSLGLYLGLGWVVVVAIKPMIDQVAPGGLWLLLIGGLFYSFGVIFYVWKKLTWHHVIWHLFVLAGSIFHFFAILLYVIP